MIVAVSPDKFKGTLSARDAAGAIAAGVREAVPEAEVRLLPMADGGEGTAVTIGCIRGWKGLTVETVGAMGAPLEAQYFADGKAAVIDSSAVVGLQQIAPERRNPLKGSSYGLGLAVRRLLDSGIEKVTIGIGGTATVDAGIGFLQGLGATLYGEDGEIAAPFRAENLKDLVRVDFSRLPECSRIEGLSDVDVPLTAAPGMPSMLMFAPQKGVTEKELPLLYDNLRSLEDRVEWMPFRPDFATRFGGAGGGLGFAIAGVLGSEVRFGAEEMISLSGLFSPRPDLVITGEGCYDRQSLQGKITETISRRCAALGIPSVVIAGKADPSLRSGRIIQATPDGTVPTPAEAAEYLTDATKRMLESIR